MLKINGIAGGAAVVQEVHRTGYQPRDLRSGKPGNGRYASVDVMAVSKHTGLADWSVPMEDASERAAEKLHEQAEKEQNFETLLELACRLQRSLETGYGKISQNDN